MPQPGRQSKMLRKEKSHGFQRENGQEHGQQTREIYQSFWGFWSGCQQRHQDHPTHRRRSFRRHHMCNVRWKAFLWQVAAICFGRFLLCGPVDFKMPRCILDESFCRTWLKSLQPLVFIQYSNSSSNFGTRMGRWYSICLLLMLVWYGNITSVHWRQPFDRNTVVECQSYWL